jgi:GNAT superfamily N-acetyltransferase
MSLQPVTAIEFVVTAFDAPESLALIEEVQAEYVVRYGGPDETPVDAAEFAVPQGIFMIGWEARRPVACGGLRLVDSKVAELKRMYVRAAARRRGIARLLLARLEAEASALGASEIRLETGARQPEAIALYVSAGYRKIAPFGCYAGAPEARHLAKRLGPSS